MRRLALSATVVYAVLLGLLVAWSLHGLVLVVIASLATAASVRGPIQWLEARRVPTGIAALLIYLGAGAAAAVILLFLYGRLGQELGSFAEDLGYVYARLQADLGFLGPVGSPSAARFPTPEELTQSLTDDGFAGLARVLATGQSLARTMGDAVLVLILSVYWTSDHRRFERLVLSFVRPARRASARRIWHNIELRLGRYLRGELLQSLLAGGVMAAVLLVLDVRWPIFWSLVVAVAWLVPLVGGLLVLGPMAIVIYAQSGVPRATIAVVAVLIVMVLSEGILTRLTMKRERGSNVLTVMTVLVMYNAFGLFGLVLSPPVAEALHALFSELTDPSNARHTPTTLTAGVDALQARLADVRAMIPGQEGEKQALRLISLADRLEALLDEASTVRE